MHLLSKSILAKITIQIYIVGYIDVVYFIYFYTFFAFSRMNEEIECLLCVKRETIKKKKLRKINIFNKIDNKIDILICVFKKSSYVK